MKFTSCLGLFCAVDVFTACHLTFAAGETNVTLAGYAPSMPYVTVNNGSVETAAYDSANHWFTVPVASGGSASASVALSLQSSPLLILQISPRSGGQLALNWNGAGKLLEADSLTGPWTTNNSAAAPYSFSPTGTSKFYRVKQ